MPSQPLNLDAIRRMPCPEDVYRLADEVDRLRAELADARSETFREAADIVRETTAPTDWNADAIANWNTATNIAEHKLRQYVATVLPPRRVLSESEHNAAWHAIEGAAGEEGADPGTVLNAVLRALGINPPAVETHVVADDSNDPESTDRCGARHYQYPDTVCTEPAGHYRRDVDPHAGPLVIDGRERGCAAWDEPTAVSAAARP